MSPLLHKSYHSRHHSWPPFRLQHFHQKENIDEDPFSFFISTSDDVEEYVVDYMNADIEDVPPRSRSLSPFHRNKSTKSRNNPTTAAISRLKKWIEKMETRYFNHRRSPPTDVYKAPYKAPEPLPASPPEPTSPTFRGRKTVQRNSRSVGNRAVRSHSGKPRIWREPSEDIYPVLEVQEDAGLGIKV